MNNGLRSGFWGVSTTTGNATLPHGNYWNAIHSTSSSALPTAISAGQVYRTGNTANFIPHIMFNNQYNY